MSIFVRMLLKRKRRRKLRARAPSTGCHKIHAGDVTASLPVTVIWRTRQGCLKLGCPHPESPMPKRLSRRSFLHYGVAAAVSPLVPPLHRVERGPGGEDLEEATVAQLQDAMRSGARTSRSICAAYLARIAELDPKLHAVLETNPDALAIADRLDAERKANRLPRPLRRRAPAVGAGTGIRRCVHHPAGGGFGGIAAAARRAAPESQRPRAAALRFRASAGGGIREASGRGPGRVSMGEGRTSARQRR